MRAIILIIIYLTLPLIASSQNVVKREDITESSRVSLPHNPMQGDPYLSADGIMFGGQKPGIGSQLTIRGQPYGYYDTGTLLSIVDTKRDVFSSRAGVNGGFEAGVSPMAMDSGFDMVSVYNQVTTMAPRLVLRNITYDATHIYPHPAMTKNELSQMRRSMWVTTNSIDASVTLAAAPGAVKQIRCYASTVLSWASDGTSIQVSGWTVPGSGHRAAGQLPGKLLDTSFSSKPTVLFGAPTKAFGDNVILEYDPRAVVEDGSQLHSFEGLEMDMWNRATHHYEASFHGITIGYNSLAYDQTTRQPVLPATDSYMIEASGNVPVGLKMRLITDKQLDLEGFTLRTPASPPPALGSINLLSEEANFIDSNRLRLLTYVQRDQISGGWPAASIHIGLHVDGLNGTMSGSRMGELVYNPPGYSGGVGLRSATQYGIYVDSHGSTLIVNGVLQTHGVVKASKPIELASYTFGSLPEISSPGSEIFCSDCRKPGESSGAGTGMLVFRDELSHWFSTAGTVAAH